MHDTVLVVAELIAAFAGLLGVSIAVYLQLIAERKPPAAWVATFFVAGCTMLLLHPTVWVSAPVVTYSAVLQLVGAAVAVIGELALARYVLIRYDVDSPFAVIHNAVVRVSSSNNP